jgi:hypothetical protein
MYDLPLQPLPGSCPEGGTYLTSLTRTAQQIMGASAGCVTAPGDPRGVRRVLPGPGGGGVGA